MVLLKRKSFYPTAKVSVLFVKYSKRKRWPGCCGWLELLFLQVPLLRLCMISSYLDRLHKWILNNTAVLPSVYVKCSGTNYHAIFNHIICITRHHLTSAVSPNYMLLTPFVIARQSRFWRDCLRSHDQHHLIMCNESPVHVTSVSCSWESNEITTGCLICEIDFWYVCIVWSLHC